MDKVKVGIIGCGNIVSQYIKGCRMFDILEVAACADIVEDVAHAIAAEFDIPKSGLPHVVLDDPEIEIVINLTIPLVHAEVSVAIINAGKHVHSEKPLAVTREDGRKVLQAAESSGVRVGCAPDTFLGGGLQTSRKLIEDGWIGRPVAATAFFLGHGPEAWHPNPDFFYKTGAGPMFDMGPYYLTSLVHLLGPVKRVSGSAQISFPQRIATSKQRYGEIINVEVPTHVAGTLDFENGVVASVITSFDVWSHALPRIEIYGSEGSLSVPDPNIFGGPVRVRRAGASEWQEVPLSHGDYMLRGVGAADLAYAIRGGRPHRASGELAFHVLDLMHAFVEASEQEKYIYPESSCAQPAPLPLGLLPGQLDA